MSIRHLSIRAKVWLSIGIFVLGFIASTTLVQLQGRDREAVLQNTAIALFPAAQRAQDAEAAFQNAVHAYKDAVLMQDSPSFERGEEFVNAAVEELRAMTEIKSDKTERIAEAKQLLSRLRRFSAAAHETYGAVVNRAASLEGDTLSRIQNLAADTNRLANDLSALEENSSRDLKEQLQSVRDQSRTQRQVAILVFLATVIFASYMVNLTIHNVIMAPILRINLQLEEERHRAEEANKSKSEFIANISHELRTPMTGILGMTQLALESELKPESDEYLSVARACAESLLTLLNEILDFSKIEAGKMALDPVEFEIRECVVDGLRIIASRAFAKGLKLGYTVDREVPEVLVGDNGRLRQIIVNLVGNSVKFTESGKVTVHVGVEAGGSTVGSALRISVTDTGIGIPKDKQELIFESFSQADGSTTRRFGGTGLGLSISKRLVELMGGKIWLESEPGYGTTFHFTALFGEPGTKPAKAEPAFAGLRALILDRNETDLSLLRYQLENWGVVVDTTTQSADAFGALERESFDLILVDVESTDWNEYAVVAQVKQRVGKKNTKVIGLSSLGKLKQSATDPQQAVDGTVLKPIKLSDLMVTLQRLRSSSAQKDKTEQRTAKLNSAKFPLRILVAEDNAVNQVLVRKLLEREGHAVTIASNGRIAVDSWTNAPLEAPFDLIFMDVQMPEMDGFAASRAIRKLNEYGEKVPIYALTAHASDEDRERCLQVGMSGFLSKPFQLKQIASVLNQIGQAKTMTELNAKP